MLLKIIMNLTNILWRPIIIKILNLIIFLTIYISKMVLLILKKENLFKLPLICTIHFRLIMILMNLLNMIKFIINYLKLWKKTNLIGFLNNFLIRLILLKLFKKNKLLFLQDKGTMVKLLFLIL